MTRGIQAVSRGIGKAEGWACRLLAAALPIMILVNVAGRAVNSPIYWMDELAIYVMVWFTMLGMSLTLHNRDAVAVTLLVDMMPGRVRRAMTVAVDIVVLAFGVALVYLCWLWFQPATLWQVGFDLQAFSAETFNFVYEEPTTTLGGTPKFLFWLIVPLVAVTITVHAVANLLATLAAGAEPARDPGASEALGSYVE